MSTKLDAVGSRAILVSALLAGLAWLTAYLVVWPEVDLRLISGIQDRVQAELVDLPIPPEAARVDTDQASGPSAISVYAEYASQASMSTILGFYKDSLRQVGWRRLDRLGSYRQGDICLRIYRTSRLDRYSIELAWNRSWCNDGFVVPAFGWATFAFGLGQLGLTLSVVWGRHVHTADPKMLHEQMINDPTARLGWFRNYPEIVRLSAWSSAIGGTVFSLIILAISAFLAAESWSLYGRWQ